MFKSCWPKILSKVCMEPMVFRGSRPLLDKFLLDEDLANLRFSGAFCNEFLAVVFTAIKNAWTRISFDPELLDTLTQLRNGTKV